MTARLPEKWSVPLNHGFSVIPVEAGGKKPMGRWKPFMTKAADRATVAGWAANNNCNVGIVTGRVSNDLVVADFDKAGTEDEGKRRGLPPTVTVKTGRGRHYYFTCPPERQPRVPSDFPAGMDLQFDGKFVVAPGSIHPDGTEYVWERHPDAYNIADCPEWLLEPVEMPHEAVGERDDEDGPIITRRTLGELRDALSAIASDNRDLWVRIGHYLKSLPGRLEDEGKALWLEWSARSAKFNEADALAKWETFNPEKPCWRSVFTEASAKWGWNNPLTKSPTGDAPPVGGLPIEWGEQIEPRLNAQWLVKRTLPQTGLALIFGHPGCGKTFLALDMAGHIATGRDWHGLPVRKGTVVYVCAEGQNGARNRIAAFRHHYGINGSFPFAMIPCSIDLHDPKADRGRLADAVRRAAKHYGEEPVLIIIDTISKTLGGGKENTDDLATYVSNCQWLSTTFGCCVMPVHHRPKDQQSTDPRGHSSLKGGLDTVILVEGGPIKRARITKQRDDEERDLINFRLKVHQLGRDDEGDPVTSCTIEQVDAAPMPINPVDRAVGRLSNGVRLIYDQLLELIDAEPMAVPTEIPDDQIDRHWVEAVVTLETWRDNSISAAGTEAGRGRDTGRRAFNRALETLRTRNIVRVWDEWAWLPHGQTGTEVGQ